MLIDKPVWRFGDKTGEWTVSLASDSIAIDTGNYQGRPDFVKRMSTVLEAVFEEFKPAQAVRTGCRFLNVIDDKRLLDLDKYVRPELLGFSGKFGREEFAFSDCRSQFDVKEGTLMLRWGGLAPNFVHDPQFMVPRPNRSWFLDIDCYNLEPIDFCAVKLTERCRVLNERI